MAQKRSSNITKTKIKNWLKSLTEPRKELDGLPICPFLAKYETSIHVAHNKEPEKLTRHFADVKDIFRLEACVVYGFWMSWDSMEQMVTRLNQDLANRDVCCFMMHPDGDESVLPIEYTLDIPILIVQKISTLEKAKQQLSKTNYYKHYK
jgi:hypothetical protein